MQSPDRQPTYTRREAMGLIGGLFIVASGIESACGPTPSSEPIRSKFPTAITAPKDIVSTITELENKQSKTQLPSIATLTEHSRLVAEYYTQATGSEINASSLASRIHLVTQAEFRSLVVKANSPHVDASDVDSVPMMTDIAQPDRPIYSNIQHKGYLSSSLVDIRWVSPQADAVTKIKRTPMELFRVALLHEFIHSDLITKSISQMLNLENGRFETKQANGFQVEGTLTDSKEPKTIFLEIEESSAVTLSGFLNRPFTDGKFIVPDFGIPEIMGGTVMLYKLITENGLDYLDIARLHRSSEVLETMDFLRSSLPALKNPVPSTNWEMLGELSKGSPKGFNNLFVEPVLTNGL